MLYVATPSSLFTSHRSHSRSRSGLTASASCDPTTGVCALWGKIRGRGPPIGEFYVRSTSVPLEHAANPWFRGPGRSLGIKLRNNTFPSRESVQLAEGEPEVAASHLGGGRAGRRGGGGGK